MATIDNYYDDILNASRGESVRDAIIEAVKLLRITANNANVLDGTSYVDFAIDEDYWKLEETIRENLGYATAQDFEDDSNVRANGPKSKYFVTSGEIYNLLNNYLRPSLIAILKYEIDPVSGSDMKEAIDYYLKDLNKARDSIISALKSKGQDPSKDDNLEELAELIRHITIDKQVETEDISISDGKKYPPGTVLDANKEHQRQPNDPYYAYKKVTVNINPNVKSINLKSNSEVPRLPSEDNVLGYSSVSVNVPNGESATSSLSGGTRTTGKNGVIVTDSELMSSKEITTKGVFSASSDSVKGYQRVVVNVELEDIQPGDTFTVTFIDNFEEETAETIIDTQEVEPFGRARCTADFDHTKTKDGVEYVFSGWSPPPLNVMSNMKVYAGYRPGTAVEENEISDSWDVIIANSGAPYPIGNYKRLVIGSGQNAATYFMQKVAEGEDDTTSTWVSMNCMDGRPYNYQNDFFVNWWTSKERAYLNGDFLNELAVAEGGASELCDYIVPVLKDTIGRSIDSAGIMELETLDRIWIPSATEMFGKRPENKITKLMESVISGFSPVNNSKQWNRLYSNFQHAIMFWDIKILGNENTSFDYSEAFGGATWDYVYPTPGSSTKPPATGGPAGGVNHVGGPMLLASPSNSSKYVRKNKNNTTAVNYMLRSVGDARDTFNNNYNGTTGPDYIMRDIVTTSGIHQTETDIPRGMAFPFGFCL